MLLWVDVGWSARKPDLRGDVCLVERSVSKAGCCQKKKTTTTTIAGITRTVQISIRRLYLQYNNESACGVGPFGHFPGGKEGFDDE